MAADTSMAANASTALAAVGRILEIQFRCCGVFFIIHSSSKLFVKDPSLTSGRMLAPRYLIPALDVGSQGYRM